MAEIILQFSNHLWFVHPSNLEISAHNTLNVLPKISAFSRVKFNLIQQLEQQKQLFLPSTARVQSCALPQESRKLSEHHPACENLSGKFHFLQRLQLCLLSDWFMMTHVVISLTKQYLNIGTVKTWVSPADVPHQSLQGRCWLNIAQHLAETALRLPQGTTYTHDCAWRIAAPPLPT